MTRVVLLSLDGFPARHVSRELTPNLVALGEDGGIAPNGGVTDLPSSTYPSHATLLSGAGLAEHRVVPRREDADTILPPALVPLEAPTLLDAGRRAGLDVRAVVGDPELVRVLRLGELGDTVWPSTPEVPEGAGRCEHGYLRDAETLPRLLEAVESGADLVFGHLNESDTAGHVHGPDSEQASERYRAADAAVGAIVSALQPSWNETLVAVVSDHDMEPVTDSEPVDLLATHAEHIESVLTDGGAAWVFPLDRAETAAQAVIRTDGVRSCEQPEGGLLLAIAEPGRRFAGLYWPTGGYHGGEATRATLAIVGGGHPAAGKLGDRLARERPSIRAWAPALAHVLEVPWPASPS